MHEYDPFCRLHAILKLERILVLALGHPREVKIVNRLDVELGDEVRIQSLLGRESQVGKHLFGVEDHLIGVTQHRLILNVLATFIFSLRPIHELNDFAELLQGKLGNMYVNIGHDGRIVRFEGVVELLLDLGHDRRKLIDEAQTVVEVKVSGGVGPRAHFEVTHRVTVRATLLEVEELRVALMNLNEISMLVHQMQDCLIFLFGSHVQCLNGDLGQAKQLLEHVL